MDRFEIRERAYDKIMHWVDRSKVEVSGLGIVRFNDEGIAVVEDVMLLEQENTSASTDINPVAICKALTEFMKSGLDGDIQFWWHSHHDMEVFWSQQDQDTKEQLTEHGWFLHTVFNKKEETKSAFTQNIKLIGDSIHYCDHDDIEMEIIDNVEEELTVADQEAIAAYNAWQKAEDSLTTLNSKKSDEIDKVLGKYKERIDNTKELIVETKDEYDQLKGDALEDMREEWDKDFDEKCTDNEGDWTAPTFPSNYEQDMDNNIEENPALNIDDANVYSESDLERMDLGTMSDDDLKEMGMIPYYKDDEKFWIQQ